MNINKIFNIEKINSFDCSFLQLTICGRKIKFKNRVKIIKGKLNKKSPTFVNYCNVSNVGDILSSPLNYFEFKSYKKLDYMSVKTNKFKPTNTIIIGGGVYSKDFLEKFKNKTLIGWGIGLFKEDDLDTSEFELLGLRDFNRKEIDNKKVFYVPCASCMHNSFDKKYPQKCELVGYFHAMKTPSEVLKSFKMKYLTNEDNIEDIIGLMGSSEYVLTNSYHGVYWATLLNKKVICVPYNSKFYGYKFPPVYATFDNWKEKIEEAKSYPEALEDSRKLNIDFYRKIKGVLNV